MDLLSWLVGLTVFWFENTRAHVSGHRKRRVRRSETLDPVIVKGVQSCLVITAVVVEGRSQSETARTYEVSKGWVSKLLARYQAEGEAAFVARSRRPKGSPNAVEPAVVEVIVAVREELAGRGLDAGPTPSAGTCSTSTTSPPRGRRLPCTRPRKGSVTPKPSKRPKSSYIRFAAERPTECWQADFIHSG